MINDRNFLKKIYSDLNNTCVPLELFRAFNTKEKYCAFLDLLGKDKAMEKRFFTNLESVKLEDIIGLSKEEFNIIPSGWLYDWNKISGCGEFEKIEKLIARRKGKGIDI